MRKTQKLLRTLKYLRWEQIAYRPLRIAQYKLYKTFPILVSRWTNTKRETPQISTHAIATIRSVFNKAFAHLNTPLEEYEHSVRDLLDNRFTFLNRSVQIDKIDWNCRYESHLWNYHLHYFGFAVPCARRLIELGDRQAWIKCKLLIDSWIAHAQIGRSDGWDAYPISLRVVNWIYAYALVIDYCEDHEFLERWRSGIYRQLDFLEHHFEFHLLANHLLKNVKALVIGGLFFDENKWVSRGKHLLRREFDEQVLGDGGHYERSSMYHAQALTDFLECFAMIEGFGGNEDGDYIETKLRAMAGFLEAMSYPDGSLALFNDSANTGETRPQPIIETARRVCDYREGSFRNEYRETGYWVSIDKDIKIIIDAGPPSVVYNTAHAHCDLFSYELWVAGQPFITDTGVHGYGGDRFREYCRSTRAHNTVMFDGIEQSEIWDTFRMARRAAFIETSSEVDNSTWFFHGSYRRYDGRLVHRREFRRTADGVLTVTDSARADVVSLASSFIHLHPDVSVMIKGDSGVECRLGSSVISIEPFAEEDAYIGAAMIKGSESPLQGWLFPDFGVALPRATIVFEYRIKDGLKFGYRVKKEIAKHAK